MSILYTLIRLNKRINPILIGICLGIDIFLIMMLYLMSEV